VVMIGEIRDLETARAATQAALTGHLVLSTLHTNDSASAPMRLIDMGVEPFLVSSTLIGAMAQRLVRKVCPKCKTEYTPEKLPKDFQAGVGEKFYRGTGCQHCRNTGFRGRSGVYELMVMNDEIAGKVMERAPSTEVIGVSKRSGTRMLREDGWLKVRRGVTTIEEVLMCTAI
jgi:type IV pilus assembly protein PilB